MISKPTPVFQPDLLKMQQFTWWTNLEKKQTASWARARNRAFQIIWSFLRIIGIQNSAKINQNSSDILRTLSKKIQKSKNIYPKSKIKIFYTLPWQRWRNRHVTAGSVGIKGNSLHVTCTARAPIHTCTYTSTVCMYCTCTCTPKM